MRQNDGKAALDLARQAAREAGLRPEVNALYGIEARLVEATALASRDEADGRDIAQCLAEVSPLLAAEIRAAFDQKLLPDFVWAPLLDVAKVQAESGDPVGAEARLDRAIGRVLTGLRGAGLETSEATMGRLALAKFQWERRRIGEADATLRSLEPHAENVTKAPALVAPFWNLKGLIENERLNYDRARVCFERSLTLFRATGSPDQAGPLNGLGLLLLSQGDYAAARVRLPRSRGPPRRTG